MAVTKSGGSSFHGAAFEYHRNDSLKAKQWGAERQGAVQARTTTAPTSAVPSRCPGLWNDKWKSYFYFDYEGYRQTGGSNRPTLSIPSLAERNGDFRDWRDASRQPDSHLRPGDAAIRRTRRLLKQQFMGCDGHTPNVICADRISPDRQAVARRRCRTRRAAARSNNYLAPAIPDTILGNSDYYMGRYRPAVRRNDHFFASIWHQQAPAKFVSTLPQSIANETFSDPQNSWVNRFNWDRTVSADAAEPHVDGVPEPERRLRLGQPGLRRSVPADRRRRRAQRAAADEVQRRVRQLRLQLQGVNIGNITTRPTFIINDMVTWTQERAHPQGRHGVPQDHGEHPHQRQPGRQRSTSVAARPGSSASTSGSPDRQLPARRGRQRRRDVP